MKKKKLTINALAGSNLKNRKKQYIVMVIGIVLAMVFSSSVVFFLSCLQTSLEESEKNLYGAQSQIYYDADKADFDALQNDGLIEEYGIASVVGNAYTDEYGVDYAQSVAYLDENAKRISYQKFAEGRYPQNETEIAMEKSALSKLAPNAKLGDEITLKMRSQNGTDLLEDEFTKTFTLVGIAENKKANIDFSNDIPYFTNSFPSVFVCENTKTQAGGKELLLFYYVEKDEKTLDKLGYVNFYAVLEDKSNNLQPEYSFWAHSTYFDNNVFFELTEKLVFIILFAVVLLVASAMIIVNAFSSNLNERKKQIGMFRTVGATKKQIIKVYGREAFIISLIAVPISILISYLLVLGISKLLGEYFFFVPNWWVLIACAVFGVICVMLASLIPLYAASRISPMQAIRNIEYARKMKRKKLKSQKQYDTSTLLAKRGNAFHRGKQVAVCTILIITILFSSYAFSYTTALIKEGNTIRMDYDYEVLINGLSSNGNSNDYINIKDQDWGFTEFEMSAVKSNQYVKSAHGAQVCKAFVLFDNYTDYFAANYGAHNLSYSKYDPPAIDNGTEFIRNSYNDTIQPFKQKYGYSEELLPTGIEAYSSDIIKQLDSAVIDGKINVDKINSGEEIILCAPKKVAYKVSQDEYSQFIQVITDENIEDESAFEKEAVCDLKAGDKIKISLLNCDTLSNGDELPSDCERKDAEVTIGAIVSELPESMISEIGMGVWEYVKPITTLSGMKHFSSDERYTNMNITLNDEYDDKTHMEIQSFLKDITSEESSVDIRSVYESNQENKRFNNSILISVAAIVILFMSISASIINNSMSAQIREGKRQIGTLRAVGASQGVLVKSYIKQMLSVFVWSYGIGFLSFVISFIIQEIYIKSKNETPFLIFSPWQTLAACIVLFAICSINLWLKIRKEMKNSIIENIREL